MIFRFMNLELSMEPHSSDLESGRLRQKDYEF